MNKTPQEISDIANEMIGDFLESIEKRIVRSEFSLREAMQIFLGFFSGSIITLFMMHKLPLDVEGINALLSDIKGCIMKTIEINDLKDYKK